MSFKTTNVGSDLILVDVIDALQKDFEPIRTATKDPRKRAHGENGIHKIILHHHGGNTKDSADKHASGYPKYMSTTMDHFAKSKNHRSYAYHYDIPFHEEKLDGRSVIYHTNNAELETAGTNFHNGLSIAVALMGCFRSSEFPIGFFGRGGVSPRNPGVGRPSDFQLKVLPKLLDYLQEKYEISNAHLGGHFQHHKRSCPGYDLERFLMDREDTGRRFCYPVNLDGSSTPTFLSTDFSEDLPTDQAKEFLAHTSDRGEGGTFPFGRRHHWHDGIHLSPKAGAPVFAVRDGWVLAARVRGEVKVPITTKGGATEERNFGSPCFVMVQHSEYGIHAGKRTLFPHPDLREKAVHTMDYYSLSMHLAPLTKSSDIPWVQRLKKRDEDLFNDLFDSEEPRGFGSLAIPIKAGEILGTVGTHNPFAADPELADDKKSPSPLLHFEMFSIANLLERFDPDAKRHKKWTVIDEDVNPIAEDKKLKIQGLSAFAGEVGAELSDLVDDAEKTDPTAQDPGLAPQKEKEWADLLSQLVTQHRSEWSVKWSKLPATWRKKYGITAKQITEFEEYLKEIQFFRRISANGFRKKGLQPPDGESFSPHGLFHFYHPIRLLHWLNGMKRTLKTPGFLYKSAPGETPGSPFRLKVDLVKTSTKGKSRLVLGPSTQHYGKTLECAIPVDALTGAKVEILSGRNDGAQFRITKVEPDVDKKTLGRGVEIDAELEHSASAGTRVAIFHFDGEYGWKWVDRFPWETALVDAAKEKGVTTP